MKVMRSSRLRTRSVALGFAVAAVLSGAASASADSIVLRWTAPGDDGDVGQASSYQLRYSETPVGSDVASWWNGAIDAGPIPAPQPAGIRESYSVSGLTSGTTYYFVLRTADEVPNVSGYSNVATRTVGDPGAPLVTPSGFQAVPVPGGVQLSWNEVLSGGGSGYKLRRRVGAASTDSLVLTAPPTQTLWTDTGVTGGETYHYTLVTYESSAESAPATVTISVPNDLLATTTQEVHGYPNPARGKVTLRFNGGASDGGPGKVRLVIFDLTGRKVCELVNDMVPAGERAVEWNCRSDQGNPVAPGLYTAILDSPLGRKTTRIAILP